MKKLFNSKETMPDDMIDGYVSAYPDIVQRGANPRVVRRTRLSTKHSPEPSTKQSPEQETELKKVALIIGNGCGHEPIAMGFVGEGLLDANVVGDVFSAPSADVIAEGIEEVCGSAGAVLLISRHEGDVINGNAAALMAQDAGLDVRPLLMYDDISSAPKGQESERRGAAGTLFIYKVLGAAAESGMNLTELVQLGEAVRAKTRTLGAAVTPGVSPLTGECMFTLPDNEIYIGMGVHGEPGVSRRKTGPVHDLVEFMVTELLEDKPIAAKTPTVVLINGSGGTTMMELLTIYREVHSLLASMGITDVSPMIGSFSTTQEMGGFSISLFTPTESMLTFWQAPHASAHFPNIFTPVEVT